MKITLQNIGKRYNRDWIFRGINYEFNSSNPCAILGANGSGKSTLLQLIASSAIASEGVIAYENSETIIPEENRYQNISYAAPYLDLYEEYTLKEAITFHSKFKLFSKNLSVQNFIELTGLEKSTNKQLKYFSSGMKQRVKLALAILSETSVLLLDEPCSNLDLQGIDWYQKLVNTYSSNKTIIVCSNKQEFEYSFCKKELILENFK